MGFGIMVNSLEPLQEALDKFPKRDTKTQGEYLAFIEIWLRDCNNKFSAFQKEYDKQVHPSRKQLSEDAFCLRNFDDEETKSKCESECIFGKKHFDLSLCRHVKNQDLVIRTSKFGKLLSGSEETK